MIIVNKEFCHSHGELNVVFNSPFKKMLSLILNFFILIYKCVFSLYINLNIVISYSVYINLNIVIS